METLLLVGILTGSLVVVAARAERRGLAGPRRRRRPFRLFDPDLPVPPPPPPPRPLDADEERDIGRQLFARARERYAGRRGGRPRWWWGVSAGSRRRAYRCYVCGTTIDTESAQWPQTRHAERAVDRHLMRHAREMNLLPERLR